MCGRYTLDKPEAEMEGWFDAVMEDFENYGPNYNVAPSHMMPVVTANPEGRRVIRPFRWGLLPFWAEEEKVSYSLINARAEGLSKKKSFKLYFKSQRCLVPASGFYEWRGKKGNKTPFYIHPTHEPMFAFAGLYNVWKSPEGKQIPTYTVVTTKANESMKDLHDRMPAMLMKEEYEEWLDPTNQDTNALADLIQSFPDDAIAYHEVSKEVNSVRNQGEHLAKPCKNTFDL